MHPEAALFSWIESLADLLNTGPGAIVQYCLDRLPLEKATGQEYGLILEMAAAAARLGLIQLSLDQSIDINGAGHYYGTALQFASRFGHIEIVETLLEAGVNPNILIDPYDTALRAAVMSHSVPAVEALLKYGTQTELCSTQSSERYRRHRALQGTALYLAVYEKRCEITHALRVSGSDVNATAHGASQLHLLTLASAWGNTSVMRLLLAAGADLQLVCKQGHDCSASALHAAINAQNSDAMKLLIGHGSILTPTSTSLRHLCSSQQRTRATKSWTVCCVLFRPSPPDT